METKSGKIIITKLNLVKIVITKLNLRHDKLFNPVSVNVNINRLSKDPLAITLLVL